MTGGLPSFLVAETSRRDSRVGQSGRAAAEEGRRPEASSEKHQAFWKPASADCRDGKELAGVWRTEAEGVGENLQRPNPMCRNQRC